MCVCTQLTAHLDCVRTKHLHAQLVVDHSAGDVSIFRLVRGISVSIS